MTQETRTAQAYPLIIVLMIAVLVFMLITSRWARAQGEITCEHVKQASLVTGQTDPRNIARVLGLKLTNAQIAEAAKCLPRKDGK